MMLNNVPGSQGTNGERLLGYLSWRSWCWCCCENNHCMVGVVPDFCHVQPQGVQHHSSHLLAEHPYPVEQTGERLLHPVAAGPSCKI